jgi:hypothetical protein
MSPITPDSKPATPPHRPPAEEKFALKFAREQDLADDFDFTSVLEPKPKVEYIVRPLNSMKPSLPDFSLPERFKKPEVFQEGYAAKNQNPMYRTTNHNLGRYPPGPSEMPLVYFGQKGSFVKETRN